MYKLAKKVRHTWRPDGSEEIRISSSDATVIESSLSPSGIVRFRVRGCSFQGEDGTDVAARNLVERLNQFGANWNNPNRPQGAEDGSDFMATDRDTLLRIQVTRAYAESTFWRDLAFAHDVEREFAVTEAAEQLWRVVSAKAARLAPATRVSLVLALDATQICVLASLGVMIAYKQQYALDTRNLGFQAVWVVGPTEKLTWQLDKPFPPGPIEIGF